MSSRQKCWFKIITAMGLFSFLSSLTGCSSDSLSTFNYGYNIKNGHVYYKQQFPKPVIDIPNVDAATFKVMMPASDGSIADHYWYGTDKRSVYYQGCLVAGSDGPSFKMLHTNYAKDKNQCYYLGQPIAGADPATFLVKADDVSVDKNHLFRRGIAIDHDTTVYESFNDGHLIHSANTVSVYDAIVPIPTGAKFKYLSYNYFALNGQLYAWENPLPDGDANSFIAIDDFFSKTNKHVYYQNKILPNADPVTYKMLQSPYGRDENHIYYYEKPLMGADVKSWEIINLNAECSRDKNAAYHQDKKITGITQADLANKNRCTDCSDNSIQFVDTTANQK